MFWTSNFDILSPKYWDTRITDTPIVMSNLDNPLQKNPHEMQ